MYYKQTNELKFPHTIPTPILGGKKHVWNDVNGGAKKVADLCIDVNTFWGGNVILLGWIKEYGMYACPQRDTGIVLGFYVHEPDKLTELGRKLVKEAFPSYNVVFEVATEHKLTAEEIAERQRVKQYYLDHGMAPNLVDHSTAEELEGLLKALESGKAEKPMAVDAGTTVAPMLDDDVLHEHDGSLVPESFLAKRAQPIRKTQRK